MKTAAILLALCGAAHASPYENAVSVQMATLDKSAISVEGEHDLGMHKLTIAGSLGARTAAMGDFDSRTVGAGVELRRWWRRPTTMQGVYTGVRVDLARTTVERVMDSHAIGGLTTGSLAATIGYRFVVFHAVELTPSVGLAAIIEGGTSSPATARTAPTLGFTIGWIF